MASSVTRGTCVTARITLGGAVVDPSVGGAASAAEGPSTVRATTAAASFTKTNLHGVPKACGVSPAPAAGNPVATATRRSALRVIAIGEGICAGLIIPWLVGHGLAIVIRHLRRGERLRYRRRAAKATRPVDMRLAWACWGQPGLPAADARKPVRRRPRESARELGPVDLPAPARVPSA